MGTVGRGMWDQMDMMSPQRLPAEQDCKALISEFLSACSSVSPAILAELHAIASPLTIQAGTTVMWQGENPSTVLIIGQGLFKLYRSLSNGTRQITGFLGPGDILCGVQRRHGAYCTAEAVTEVQACAIPRESFLRLVEAHPDLCFAILVAATDEIEVQSEHITLLGRKRAPERLAAFLLSADLRWRKLGTNRAVVHLPMSRADIADYLGLTIETVSRAFARLRNQELITTPSMDSAVLNNLPALYALAGFDETPAKRISLGL